MAEMKDEIILILDLSEAAYAEIKKILVDGGYKNRIMFNSSNDEIIDMRGMVVTEKGNYGT